MGQKNSTYVDDVQPETRQDILFTSLGVVVLDELLFFPQKRLVDVIGGLRGLQYDIFTCAILHSP